MSPHPHRRRRPAVAFAVAAILAGALLIGAPLSTTAGFTADAVVPGSTAATGSLGAGVLTADAVASGSIGLSWTAASAGAATPEYTVTRTAQDGSEPVDVYTGTDTGVTDLGNLPAELDTTTIISTAAGSYHSLALADDGTVWAWGLNYYGQLGDGTTADRSTPVQVSIPEGRTITDLAAGVYHSLALADDGTAWAWGHNAAGQLGDGTTADRSTPVQVSIPEGRTITDLAAGVYHSLALADDGTVWAWGYNNYGQLGDGTTTNRLAPVQVSIPEGRIITDLAAGVYHSLVLADDGTVWAWGYNNYGQLGDGTTAHRSTPVQVSIPEGRTVTSIAAGDHHSLVLAGDGTVWAWGYNYFGQLGDGTTAHRSTSVQVSIPEGRTVTDLAAGGYHSLVLAGDGTVGAWGYNDFGQLGDGTTTDRSMPVAAEFPAGEPCPEGSVPVEGAETCSLIAGSEYIYTLTTRVGGWSAVSEPLTVTTAGAP